MRGFRKAQLVVGFVALAGCGDDGESRTRREQPVEREPAPTIDERVARSRPAMGTVFRITVVGTSEPRAEPAIRAAFEEIARLEQLLSEWIPTSEISRINQAAGREPIPVSRDTFAVVQAGVNVSRWSEGAFDLSWAALFGVYDFRRGRERLPQLREVRSRLSLINWEDIELDQEAQTVFLRRPGMTIGTGGIAKGYALDRAGEILRAAGITNYMLFGGGQVQVAGRKENGARWRVGIRHPRQETHFAYIEPDQGSISTSGDYEHFFIDDRGQRWHHILDLRSGLPVTHTRSVTVLAPTGLYADALSTAAFALGGDRALQMFERMPFHADFLLVTAENRLVMTPGLRERLVPSMDLAGDHLP